MRLAVLGPGRAGLALAIAAVDAGHDLVALIGRDVDHLRRSLEVAEWDPDTPRLGVGDPAPECDLLVLAVRDDEIAHVARHLADPPSIRQSGQPPSMRQTTADSTDVAVPSDSSRAVVHLSGLKSIHVLGPLAEQGWATGAFHPLQTLPTPRIGASRLTGAWAGITAGEALGERLAGFAQSLGMRPFRIDDDDKATYHAAAAACANFPIVALTMARDLFTAAGVEFETARPLVEAAIANAFDIGPRAALTGPVARGDVATVEAQLEAVAARTPAWLDVYATFVTQIAAVAGRAESFGSLVAQHRGDE